MVDIVRNELDWEDRLFTLRFVANEVVVVKIQYDLFLSSTKQCMKYFRKELLILIIL